MYGSSPDSCIDIYFAGLVLRLEISVIAVAATGQQEGSQHVRVCQGVGYLYVETVLVFDNW